MKLIYLISRVFLPWTFLIFWPTVIWLEIGLIFFLNTIFYKIGNSKYTSILFSHTKSPNQIQSHASPPPSIHSYCRIRIPISCIGYIGVVIVSDRALRFDGKIVTRRKIPSTYTSITQHQPTHKSFLEKIPPATNLQTCN